MAPLCGFITAEEFEAVLVHRFSILNDGAVCVDAAKETEEQFHELQNEVKNPPPF